MKEYQKNLKDLFRFDSIRKLKILEMCQFCFIGFILGYINGNLINQYLLFDFEKGDYVNKEYPRLVGNLNPKLWIHLLWDMFIIIISTYYLKKISMIFPFILSHLNKNYKSGLKEENIVGFTIGVGFIYLRVLDNFNSRISLLLGEIDE